MNRSLPAPIRWRFTAVADAHIVRPHHWGFTLVWPLCAGVAAASGSWPLLMGLGFLALLGEIGSYYDRRLRLLPPSINLSERVSGTVAVDAQDLWIRDVRIPLAHVETGWFDPARRVAVVRTRAFDASFPFDRDQAHALLNACGAAPGQRALRVRLASRRSTLDAWLSGAIGLTCVASIAMAGFGAIRGTVAGACVAAAVALAVGADVLRQLRGSIMQVDAAGLTFERPHGEHRRVPYGSVRDIAFVDDGVRVCLRDGEALVFRLAGDTEARTAALVVVERIRELMALGVTPGASLDRRGRSLTEWRVSLARLCPGTADPAAARNAVDELVRVVKDKTANVERRVGAALALSSLRDDAIAEVVRAASSLCGDPRVQVALTRAIEGRLSDVALEAALAVDAAGATATADARGKVAHGVPSGRTTAQQGRPAVEGAQREPVAAAGAITLPSVGVAVERRWLRRRTVQVGALCCIVATVALVPIVGVVVACLALHALHEAFRFPRPPHFSKLVAGHVSVDDRRLVVQAGAHRHEFALADLRAGGV